MNQSQLVSKVNSSMYQQINNTGYATAVQTLMDLGILSKEDYERWRNGQIPYLEKVCKINLKKLAGVLEEMKRYAGKNNLKPSFTFYKQWGRKNKTTVQLRFSKTGNEYIEKLYATHYVKTIDKAYSDGMEVVSAERNAELLETVPHKSKEGQGCSLLRCGKCR